MEILKSQHLVITREPARRVVSAFMHPTAGQFSPRFTPFDAVIMYIEPQFPSFFCATG
jgi:hypothetical protein